MRDIHEKTKTNIKIQFENEEYLKALQIVTKNERLLMESLSEEMIELLIELIDAQRIINENIALENRLRGVQEGMNFNLDYTK